MFLERFRYVHFPPTEFPLFQLDEKKCIGCKTCVRSCPTSCLDWDKEKKIPIARSLMSMELACLGCNNCEAVCPKNAIRMRGKYFVLKGRYKTDDKKYKNMTFPFKKKKSELVDIEKELNVVEKLILKRRSVRIFKERDVPKELIDRIIEAGRFAPTAGNGQPFKFLVVQDKNLNKEIDKKCAQVLYKVKNLYLTKSKIKKALVYLLSYLSPNKWDQRPIAAMEKMEQIGGIITYGAPVVIHILKDVRGISTPDIDIGIAGQNMVLAAHSLGLGTCFIGFIASAIPYLPSVKKMLGIKYPYKLALSICLGYPAVKYDRFIARGEIPVEFL